MPFTRLPAELICQIAEALPRHEHNCLRLVCRYVEQAIFDLFKIQFREIRFMITTCSLEILHGISTHPVLADVVEHVWFNPDCFTHVDLRNRDDARQPDEDTSPWARRGDEFVEL